MHEDAAHWEELQRLFHLAEALPPAERAAALEAANPDPVLRRRALEILAAAEAPAADAGIATGAIPPSEGGQVGAYRLLRTLGSGGMGTVYLAERLSDGIALRSALKVLAAHATDRAFIERFRVEQRNLATLDHPHITRMLDAGWTGGGLPYLVMEYVAGERLDAFCDGRGLGVAARLRLFLQVCAAVSHAHRNLVLHLDLKPSNLLVTEDGTVKLLDFGTSRLVQPGAASTGAPLATPAYASPEQLLDEPVSTASDIYGLGATLHQLLAGRTPFADASGAVVIERAASGLEPAPPARALTEAAAAARGVSLRALRRLLGGDLGTIVSKCLARQPAARYASVDALAADLQRYLAHLPILARPQTLRYRTACFVRRRRVGVAVSAVVALALLGSSGYAWHRQREALVAAERAVQMQTFLYGIFKMSNPTYTGKPTASIAEFLQLGMRRLPEFIHDPGDLSAAQLGMAESLFQSGALAEAGSALAEAARAAHTAGERGIEAEALAYASDVEYQLGHVEAGRALARQVKALSASAEVPARVRILGRVFAATDEDGSGQRRDQNLADLQAAVDESVRLNLGDRDLAFALHGLATDLDQRGRRDEALKMFERLRGVYERDPLAVCDRAEVDAWLAWIHAAKGDVAGSLPLHRQGYDGYVACAGADSQGAVGELSYWADALTRSGQPREAIAMLAPAVPAWRSRWSGVTEMLSVPLFLARAYNAAGRRGGTRPVRDGAAERARARGGRARLGAGARARASLRRGEAPCRDGRPRAQPGSPLRVLRGAARRGAGGGRRGRRGARADREGGHPTRAVSHFPSGRRVPDQNGSFSPQGRQVHETEQWIGTDQPGVGQDGRGRRARVCGGRARGRRGGLRGRLRVAAARLRAQRRPDRRTRRLPRARAGLLDLPAADGRDLHAARGQHLARPRPGPAARGGAHDARRCDDGRGHDGARAPARCRQLPRRA
jgi:serine/threonine-protein kinase